MHEPPYYTNYSKGRLLVHSVVTSKYFDLAIAAVIGLNVVTMAMEFYMMPKVRSHLVTSSACHPAPSGCVTTNTSCTTLTLCPRRL